MTPTATLLAGDVLDCLKDLPDRSVQCTVTSPPYWAVRKYSDDEREIGQEPLGVYVERLRATFAEVRRVTHPSGLLWLNLNDSFVSVGGRGPQGASGIGNHSQRQGFTHNRLPVPPGCKREKDLAGVPWEVAKVLRADGWYWRGVIPWIKRSGLGESVPDRPAVSHEYWLLFAASNRSYYDRLAVRLPGKTQETRVRRTADWYFDSLDLLIEQQEEWLAHLRTVRQFGGGVLTDTFDLVALDVAPGGHGNHPAAFPRRLVKPLIAASTKPGETVLDPFCGSGTTVVEAVSQGRSAIGVDLLWENLDRTATRLVNEGVDCLLSMPAREPVAA